MTFDSNGIRDVTDSLTVLQFRANNKSGGRKKFSIHVYIMLSLIILESFLSVTIDLEGVVIGHVTSDYSLVYANGESDSTTWPCT